MTLAELKSIIEKKYLHTSKPVMRECTCGGLKKGEWDSCSICGHPNASHNGGIGNCMATWEEGGYTLSSGAKSANYFDIKGMMGYYDHMCRLLNELSKKLPPWKTFASLGGCELGGIPLVVGLSVLDQMYEYSVCYIRKSQRIHGLKKMIEGAPRSPILLVDDVISSTDTTRYAMIECEKSGYKICGVLCVINRTPLELTTISDVPIYSLFKESDFT